MISQPLYVWYHIHYMWDLLSTIFMTSYPLCMRSQPCVLITPHSAYVWHHLRYRSRHIHSIAPSHNLYDFTSTSGMTSHPLYQTSHQLYLWHHTNYINDITATKCMISHLVHVRHSVHYIYDFVHTRYDNRTLCVDYTTLGICMTSFALQKPSHPLYHTKPQSL